MEEKVFDIRKRCFYFSRDVVQFVSNCKYERVFISIFDQLLRSATSIGANVVEARAGSSRSDWRKFIIIALKSANETKYWLALVRDTMKVDSIEVDRLLKEADEISRILARIILKADFGDG